MEKDKGFRNKVFKRLYGYDEEPALGDVDDVASDDDTNDLYLDTVKRKHYGAQLPSSNYKLTENQSTDLIPDRADATPSDSSQTSNTSISDHEQTARRRRRRKKRKTTTHTTDTDKTHTIDTETNTQDTQRSNTDLTSLTKNQKRKLKKKRRKEKKQEDDPIKPPSEFVYNPRKILT